MLWMHRGGTPAQSGGGYVWPGKAFKGKIGNT